MSRIGGVAKKRAGESLMHRGAQVTTWHIHRVNTMVVGYWSDNPSTAIGGL